MKVFQDIEALVHHSPEWHEARRQGIGGSDAAVLMGDDWFSLWEEKTGRTEPEDLSGVLPVVMGQFTERLNAWWFQKQTGMAVSFDDCEGLVHSEYPFLRANLDARAGMGIVEFKHVNDFVNESVTKLKPFFEDKGNKTIYEKYYPQCQHQMLVSGAPVCYLVAFIGTGKWDYIEIGADDIFQQDLLARYNEFWKMVVLDTPPDHSIGAASAVVIDPDTMREVDMSTNNQWCDSAFDFVQNQEPARLFEAAKAALKGMVEKDVKKATGGGVVATKAKNGSVTIKAVKA